MFQSVSPESVGISSGKLLQFLKTLDDCRLHTHSLLIARGNSIVAESYYAPFHAHFLHRMYSVSKSFVAIAVGVAVTEGLFGMDDVIVDYFPEFRNENTDGFHDTCTVRDMLTMQSNIGQGMQWWGRFSSRVAAYYSLKTSKIPGTLYFYDSIGSFLLGCMIEKLTGKPFLEYLKEKVLLDIGFSKASYTLREPGGFTIGDSGVICTTRDLALFSRFIMNKGCWNGRQYIDPAFMEEAVSKQAVNDLDGGMASYDTEGYGFLIRRIHDDGFILVGLGDQLAICDTKRDILFVITSDNQASKASRYLIYHEFLRHFLPTVADAPLPENPADKAALDAYLSSRTLVALSGDKASPLSSLVNGIHYTAQANPLGLTGFCLTLGKEDGTIRLEMNERVFHLDFNLCTNKQTRFSFGERAVADMMGRDEPGKYDCAVSAAWVSEKQFSIMAQVIDTYFGCLNIHIGFTDNRATILFRRSGQYVFEGIDGFAIAYADSHSK